MAEDWVTTARRELLRLRAGTTGWGYRAGTPACVEPTVLASLGLLATQSETSDDGTVDRSIAASADWLAKLQRPDGSLGLSESRPTPGWTTPYAILLWRALGAHEDRRRRAVAWLLEQAGESIPAADDPDHIVGHDTMLVGWPWVAQTHSWLEPTALAVLALRGEGLGDHPRVEEGLRLIRDRAIRTGGWNYGNKSAFGHDLRPQPAPTGLALLTLASVEKRSALIDRAIDYLRAALPGVRASASLGWGLIGLRAWGQRPVDASSWLAEASGRASGRADASPRLAHLLLAADERTLKLLDRSGFHGRTGSR